MKKIQLECDRKYLLIPIAIEQPLKEIFIYADGKQIYDFKIPVADDEEFYAFQYYAPIPIGEYAGSVVSLEGEVSGAFLEAIAFSDEAPDKADTHPAVHFSANTGWINDPNGFFYYNGVYHLYFQYNPFDTRWENMCWGHAVSHDLLHWEQQETAIYPDEDGTIFSGCAIVNERGLLELPSDSPIFFYTSAGNQSKWSEGKRFVQKIAYSADGGRNVTKTGITAVPHIAGGNRDPKVYWHEESEGYYMVLYLKERDFAILRSGNLKDWEMTQRLSLPDAWECPDLVRVPVEEGGFRWVFWCADGFYFIGEFDGYTFTRTGGKMQAYASGMPYAAQTCYGADRILSIPWLRCKNRGRTYTGTMGIPRELSLTEQDGGLRLRQRPVRELLERRKEIEKTGKEGEASLYQAQAGLPLELTVTLGKNLGFCASIGGIRVSYDPGSGKLVLEGCVACGDEENWRQAETTRVSEGLAVKEIKLDRDPDVLSILADHEILEITADEGLVCAAFEIPFDRGSGTLKVAVEADGRERLFEIRDKA